MRARRRFPALFTVVAVGLSFFMREQTAAAQLHWDASATVGITKRTLGDRPAGGPDAGVGPSGQLTAHVALFPLVRLGGYVGHDISPMSSDFSARDLTYGGLHAKLLSPWPRGVVRSWLFLGLGYAGTYARSSRFPMQGTLVHGASGTFFDIPFGFGASYMLRKPIALCAELGARVGFAHGGPAYALPGPKQTSFAPAVPGESHALPSGTDAFAVGLSVGVLVDL